MSLKELQANVAADAALHLPDISYDSNSHDHSVEFEALPLSTLLDENEADVAGLRIATNRQDPETAESLAYMFTPWSRSQLLSLLGTREKWFSFVGLSRQVEELNARLHGLHNYRLRTMRAVDEDFPVRLIRGLVSSQYVEISNVSIMEAVVAKAAPGSMALRAHSGISDRAFYSYIVSPTPITIPGTSFFAYPGAVVKNSEVGYTSLWVIPALIMRAHDAPVVIEAKYVLKRIHRGQVDLAAIFEDAFTKCAATWADLVTQIPALAAKTYGTEDAAVAVMERLLASTVAKKEFILNCTRKYKAGSRRHTALDIFEATTETCEELIDRDETYAVGAIAGAVLYKLLF